MKKAVLITALMLCVLFLFGCEEKAPENTQGNTTDNTELALKKRIEEKDCLLGIGFFGYVDSESNEEAVRDYINASALKNEYPFLGKCSPMLFEGTELYAFVPANENITVTVCSAEISENGEYTDRKDVPLYKGKSGETVILRCNISEICANVLILVTDGEKTLEFHPSVSLKDGRAAAADGCCDISASGEKVSEEKAWEQLLAADEVNDALKNGMKLICTGDEEKIDGKNCLLFALGTDNEEQFVRERLYAVSGETVYLFDAVNDSWQKIY